MKAKRKNAPEKLAIPVRLLKATPLIVKQITARVVSDSSNSANPRRPPLCLACALLKVSVKSVRAIN